ncbi:MAG: hypothetical protein AAFO07_00270 [Bacteroidota bacterium]
MTRILSVIFCWVLAIIPIYTQSLSKQDVHRNQILEAIKLAGQYARDIIMDDEGKSHCDYEMLSGQWFEYEPAWHTGQLIWGLLEAYKITGDTTFLHSAVQAGNWWIGLSISDHPKLEGYLGALHGGSVKDPLINFTTIADGTPGLFELSRVTQNPIYAEVASKAGDWAMINLYLPEYGLLYDLVDIQTGEIWVDKSPHFAPEKKLSIHDVARPNNEGFLFGDMYRFSEDKKYLDFFISLCNSLVEKQSENGFWMDYHPNNLEKEKIHPRFNLWNAESLLVGYQITKDQRYLDSALKTARAVQKWQRRDGRIYYRNRPDGTYDSNSICGSAVAFAGILWLEFQQLGYDEFDKSIERSLAFVLNNQFPADHPDPNLRGAFLETWSKTHEGEARIFVRDIATSFGLRFLSKYLQTR